MEIWQWYCHSHFTWNQCSRVENVKKCRFGHFRDCGFEQFCIAEIFNSTKLISRKIWVEENFWNFHAVTFTSWNIIIYDFLKKNRENTTLFILVVPKRVLSCYDKNCFDENSLKYVLQIVLQYYSQYGKTSPKNISSNQLFSNYFSKNVTFTKFLPQMCETKLQKISTLWHCAYHFVGKS